MRLRTDELKREEMEAGALLGRQFWTPCLHHQGQVLDGGMDYQDRKNFAAGGTAEKKAGKIAGGGWGSFKRNTPKPNKDEGYEKELNDLAAAENLCGK